MALVSSPPLNCRRAAFSRCPEKFWLAGSALLYKQNENSGNCGKVVLMSELGPEKSCTPHTHTSTPTFLCTQLFFFPNFSKTFVVYLEIQTKLWTNPMKRWILAVDLESMLALTLVLSALLRWLLHHRPEGEGLQIQEQRRLGGPDRARAIKGAVLLKGWPGTP